MFKNLKTFDKTALIRSEVIREQLSNFESEVLRGISTLAILSIIHRHLKEGVYGYQLLKELNEETQHRIIIEGPYPLKKTSNPSNDILENTAFFIKIISD